MKTISVNSKGSIENETKTNTKVAEPKINNLPVSREFDNNKKEENKNVKAEAKHKVAEQPIQHEGEKKTQKVEINSDISNFIVVNHSGM